MKEILKEIKEIFKRCLEKEKVLILMYLDVRFLF